MSDAEDPVALARRLAAQARARTAPAAPAAAPEAAPAAAKRSLLDRAPRPLSPQEAMQKAIAEEAAREQAKVAEAAAKKAAVEEAKRLAEQARRNVAAKATHTMPPPPPAPAPAPAPVAAPEAPSLQDAPVRSRPAPIGDPAAVLAQRLPGFEVAEILPVRSAEAFKALWTSHRVRAAIEEDLSLLVTADVLLDAILRLPAGALFGARITRDGTGWAVFIDAQSGVLLGLQSRPEIHLAGLG